MLGQHQLVSLGLIFGLLGTASRSGNTSTKKQIVPRDQRADAAIRSNALRSGASDPELIDLPAPRSAKTLKRFLASGVGTKLVELLTAVTPLAAAESPTPRLCRMVAAELRKLGTPGELLELSSNIVDEPSKEVATNLVSEVSLTLAGCGSAPDEHASQVAFDWVLWARRVDEVMA